MEYPFKDLLPLDEVLAREGYYKDWTHLDPEVFYSLTQISEYIKTKGYGVDVRLLIAQLAEHFGLKTTQVVDLANLLQQKFTNLQGVTQSFTNNINSLVEQMEADKDAVIANATVDSEVILARGGKATLGKRFDDTDAQLEQRGRTLGDILIPEVDDTERIQRLIDSLRPGEIGIIPPNPTGNYRTRGIKIKSYTILMIHQNIDVIGDGSIGLDFESCLYAYIGGNARIMLTDVNQVGIKIHDGVSEVASQLNTIFNIGVEGNHQDGSVSMIIHNSWMNNFYNCFLFRSIDGLRFTGPHANANNFYGCEVRGDRTNPKSGLAVLQSGGGHSNVFHGGAVENYKDGIKVTGGSLKFLGTWIEGFGVGRRVFLEGGTLSITDGYFHALVEIKGGEMLVFENNKMPSSYDSTLLNVNFPLIQYVADVATKLYTSANQMQPKAYLSRPGKYNLLDGTGWKDRSIQNVHEVSDEYNTNILVELATSLEGVSGTRKVISFGNAGKLSDSGLELDNSGYFRPFADGLYRVSVTARLSGISGAYGQAALGFVSGIDRVVVDRVGVTTRDNEGVLTLHGSKVVKLTAGTAFNVDVLCIGELTSYTINDKNTFMSIERL